MSPVPIVKPVDSITREIAFTPTKTPYDPRWMLEGRPSPSKFFKLNLNSRFKMNQCAHPGKIENLRKVRKLHDGFGSYGKLSKNTVSQGKQLLIFFKCLDNKL